MFRGRRSDCETLAANDLLRSSPVFVGPAIRFARIFIQAIGEAFDLLIFSNWRW